MPGYNKDKQRQKKLLLKSDPFAEGTNVFFQQWLKNGSTLDPNSKDSVKINTGESINNNSNSIMSPTTPWFPLLILIFHPGIITRESHNTRVNLVDR